MAKVEQGKQELTEEELANVIAQIQSNPEKLAAVTAAAMTGDALAARVLMSIDSPMMIVDWEDPKKSEILPHQDSE